MNDAGGKDGKRHSARGSQLGRGASIGRYLILGLLGKGGMGEVYAAYDPELDRKIALKLLRPQAGQGTDPVEGRARLLREAQAIARLSDPNVVVVFDVGMFEDRVFLAMEFVDGHTLGYWLHAQPRKWQEILKVFQRAGQGLASAHKAGIVHRDFKPENVMLGADGAVRVMDFGLARAITPDDGVVGAPGDSVGGRTGATPTGTGAITPAGRKSSSLRSTLGLGPAGESAIERSTTMAGGTGRVGVIAGAGERSGVVASAAGLVAAAGPPAREWSGPENPTRDLSRATVLRDVAGGPALDSPLTMTGAMMGTPAYMAPEQFRNGAVDARADQFAFCVALYEALYSERPFKGKSINDLTVAVLAGKVSDAPSYTKVPNWLRKIVLRGLRVNRNERHASMDTLLTELRKDPAVKHRRWAMASGVMILVALLGAGLVRAERKQRTRCLGTEAKLVGVWELPTAKGGLSARKEAIKKTFLATGKRYAADSFKVVTDALDRYVTDWNKMHRDSCEATNMRGEQSAEVLDLRTACLNDRFAEVRALTNVLADANGDVVEKSVQATQSLRSIEQCADIRALKAVVKPPHDPAVRRAVADVRTSLADVKALANAGRYKKANERLGSVLTAARETKYQPAMAETLLQLAWLRELSGDPLEAERNYEEAVWLAEACRYDQVAVEAADQLIQIVGYRQNRHTDGERWGRYAGAILARLGSGYELLAAWQANNLAMVLHNEGRHQEALDLFEKALEVKVAALGAKHFDVAVSLANVAFQLHEMGRTADAIEKNGEALVIFQETLGKEHPRSSFALTNAAEYLNAAGRHDEAQAFAEEALRVLERELSANHPDLAAPLMALGMSLIGGGKPNMAVAPLERALRIREASNSAPELLGETRFALAQGLAEMKARQGQSIVLARQARRDYGKDPGGADHVSTIDRWLAAHGRGADDLVR